MVPGTRGLHNTLAAILPSESRVHNRVMIAYRRGWTPAASSGRVGFFLFFFFSFLGARAARENIELRPFGDRTPVDSLTQCLAG